MTLFWRKDSHLEHSEMIGTRTSLSGIPIQGIWFGSQSIIASFPFKHEALSASRMVSSHWSALQTPLQLLCLRFCRPGTLIPLHTNCDCWLVPGWETAKRADIPERHHYPGWQIPESPDLTIQSYFIAAWGRLPVSQHQCLPVISFGSRLSYSFAEWNEINHGDIDQW